ncbi:MAG: DNA polymerase III subunit [Candidatus Nomurabacteria bacterium]|jgi:DNA polymerase-3 subunit delta'|nr:DNA polymerase III subunit [Candidatus Nomurabacteria bacterium]
MNLDGLEQLPKITAKTHFAIFVLPRRYGINEVRAVLAAKNTLFLEPKVHEKQKTAIINVDDIAELERVTRTKQKNSLSIVLLSTETMGEAPQNKFLKLLEEPGSNIHFVFITENPSNLLPTVLSRGQVYHIKKLSRADSLKLAKNLNPKLETLALQQIMFLASGLPGEIKKLATNDKYLAERAELVAHAKTLLQGGDEDILLLANQLKDHRVQAIEIIDLAVVIAKEILKKNPGFLEKLSALETTYEQLSSNANIRLAVAANLLQNVVE